MLALRIDITGFVDDSQPGWVELRLVDAAGVTHVFIEKVPVVSDLALDRNSRYPQPGVLACTLVERSIGDDGSLRLIVDTARPWGVSSLDDETRFVVRPDQTLELAHADA